MKKIDICVVVPALNEENTIREVVEGFQRQVEGKSLSVLVVDNGSTDRTAEIARKCGAEVVSERIRGKGMAMRRGIEYAEGDVYVFIDADGTYSPTEIWKLVDPIVKDLADMVIGSRLAGQMEELSMTGLNKIGNHIMNRLVRIAFRCKVNDILSGYRAVSRRCLDQLVLLSSHFEIETEMTIECLSHGFRVIEVPISYFRRKGGPSKLRPFNDGVRILRSILFFIMNTRPLFFFSVLSVPFFASSLVPIGYILYRRVLVSEHSLLILSLFYLLITTGFLIFVSGLLAELVVTTRRKLEYSIRRLSRNNVQR